MKRIYEFIAKANQVLLFFVIIGGTVFISYLVYQTSRRYEPPHVAVAQPKEEAKESIVRDVRFLGQSESGLYVFGIVKRVVSTGSPRKNAPYSFLPWTIWDQEMMTVRW